MVWFHEHLLQITGVASVMVLLVLGRGPLLPLANSKNKVVMWLAFAITVVCGAVLGWAVFDLVGWLIHLPGTVGGLFSAAGGIASVWAGSHGALMVVALVRDIVDGKPDEDARKGALWIPTLLPAGWSATYNIASKPTSGVGGVAAGIMVAIIIVYAHRIGKAALDGQKARKLRHWFAAAAHLHAGVMAIPLALYLDAQLADWLDPDYMTALRIVEGTAGIALAIAAVYDIAKDRIPDRHVRNLAAYGVPLLVLAGATAIAFISGNANSGLDLLAGGQ